MKRKAWVAGEACFVPHTCGVTGHYMKTERCVAFIKCPQCDAQAGEACRGSQGPVAQVHNKRRKLYTKFRRHEADMAGVREYVITVEEHIDGETEEDEES